MRRFENGKKIVQLLAFAYGMLYTMLRRLWAGRMIRFTELKFDTLINSNSFEANTLMFLEFDSTFQPQPHKMEQVLWLEPIEFTLSIYAQQSHGQFNHLFLEVKCTKYLFSL